MAPGACISLSLSLYSFVASFFLANYCIRCTETLIFMLLLLSRLSISMQYLYTSSRALNATVYTHFVNCTLYSSIPCQCVDVYLNFVVVVVMFASFISLVFLVPIPTRAPIMLFMLFFLPKTNNYLFCNFLCLFGKQFCLSEIYTKSRLTVDCRENCVCVCV